MMYRWGATLILAVLLFSAKTKGQNIAFNYLTVENGLSHNAVLSITQDSRGFMWYGTRYGLNRYDGQRFRIYKRNNTDSSSLNDNLVLALLSDSKNTLWVGTSQGLNKYDPAGDKFERISMSPYPISIYAIFEDKKGRLWIGSPSGLYLKTATGFRHFTANASGNSIAGTHVRCIYEDKKGYIWVGTTNGLSRLIISGTDIQFENFRHEEGNPNSLPVNYISAITADSQERLWIGMLNGGVCVYQPTTRTFSPVTNIINDNVREIIKDKAGKLWVGTQEGLTIIDPVNNTSNSYQHDPGGKKSLSQNSIHSLFEDVNGSVWIGTYFGGINMIHSYNTSFSTLQNNVSHSGISNNVVSSILEDGQHNLWIGTEGGGLNYLNRKTDVYTYYKHDPNDPASLGSNLVKIVYNDKDNNTWVGTHGGGLNLLERGSGKFKHLFYDKQDPYTLTLETTAILETTDGRFWVGTNTGLHLFKREGTQLTEVNDTALLSTLSKTSIRYLYEDSQQRLWIGSTYAQYVLKGNILQTVCTDCYNNSITEDRQGNIWLCLYYGGLIKLDQEMKIIARYTEKDGLPSSNILGLLEDDKQNFWISTDNGLVKFDPAKKAFQTYTTSDGIAGNEFNYGSFLEDSNGEFFFGGYNGITSFFPGKIEANTYSAPMVFTGLRLFNQPVQDIGFTKALTFKYNQEVFTIEYALLNYIKSNKNRYAYKLEGIDRDWIETNGTAVTYTNLPSGNYTFLVKGANNDGVWSEPARMRIKILPPFWLTWWAYCIYALLVASVFFLVTRFFFMRALLTKEEELHQVKLNFFTNISHEIRTHLTLLMAPVEKMIDTFKKDDPVQQQLFNVKNNANRLLKLVSELMDFRKAETNHLKLYVEKQDLIPFLQEIYNSFSELSPSRNIKTSFVHNMEHVFVYFDREQLEKVCFNLLSNAFKFTPDGGVICLSVEQQKDTITIQVIDNGRGIAPEYLDKLFSNFFQVADHGHQNTGYGIGLALSRNIVELHKGSLTVESEPANRTCFTVTLLQGNKHFEGTQHVLGYKPAEEIPAIPEVLGYSPSEEITFPVTATPETTPEMLGNNPSAFTLLIVEDNQELRKLIRETFEQTYQVLESENGAQGLAIATEQIPDLVISDVMMPEMDGLEFCSRLKTDERTSHIPVILLTAKSSQADHVSGLENGADLYLSKPFSTRVLELNVRNLLALREKMRMKFSRQLLTETPEQLDNSVDNAFLQKVIQLVEEHMDEPEFGVEMLSRKVAMSQPVLYKKLKALTDMSVNDFVKSLRLKKAAALILKKQHTVYEVAYMVGYADRKYFSKEFKKQFGKTPTEFAGERETE
ncbi:response regulator [Chitinophaga sp. SYP-B3965]|uniref:hybrid sensor histidine kinase/response regulator transcription factor n=1 Tax=Chitinophaga sp. SYP-B3965 TaxID=2663120 RepID=UPI001299A957|nr:hybrid sensor histidine kinase/response regulator transcription factor [Chitinophaga sp. SYP-B3965]MRG45803.1 response regulator [Chitinophaga sp. SYP-B3965]